MERISLWTMGLLALGWQANFAVAVDPDGPALQPPGQHGPALQPPAGGPELFPAAVAQIAVEVKPEAPAGVVGVPVVPAQRLVHPAALPMQRVPAPVRPAAYVETAKPQPQAPDLLPGIPAALVPPAAIPQVAAPEPAAAPRMAMPPRVPTYVQHVTCPKPEPTPVVHTKVATIQTVVEPVPEPVAYPPGQTAAPMTPAVQVQLPPPPPAVAAPAPTPLTERTTLQQVPMTIAAPEQPVAFTPVTQPVAMPSAVKAGPVMPVSQPQRMPAVEAIEPPPSVVETPAPVVEAPRPVQPVAAPVVVQPQVQQPYVIQPAAPVPHVVSVPAAQPVQVPAAMPVVAAPAPAPVATPAIMRARQPQPIQPVSAEVIYSAPVPAAVPIIEMPPPLEAVQVPAAVPILEAPPLVPVQPVQPAPRPVSPVKPVTGGPSLPFEPAGDPVQPRKSPYTITSVLNSADPMPAGPAVADEATSPTAAPADDRPALEAGEAKGAKVAHGGDEHGGCLDGCCGDLWNCCCSWAGDGPTVTASTGFRILKPYWKNNPAFFVSDGTTGIGTDFDFTTQFVPQFTIGAVGANGFGFRLGWWGFANQTNEFSVIAPGGNAVSAAPLGAQLFGAAATGISAASKLRFNVWDFEATELVEYSSWYFLLTGGLRYAHISQDYAAVLTNGGGTPLATLASGHNFNGVGPTVSLTGKRPIGLTNLYFFGSARGSVLFGNAKQSAVLGAADAYASADAVVPEAEVEIGLGYHRSVGRARFFAQAGLIGDVWYEAGNSSRSYITPVIGGAPGLYNSADNNLGLLGLDFRLGVNY